MQHLLQNVYDVMQKGIQSNLASVLRFILIDFFYILTHFVDLFVNLIMCNNNSNVI